MILALSDPPYEIGARRVGCTDADARALPDQPYTLLREVTQREWVDWCFQECGPTFPTLSNIGLMLCARFFEVSSD